MSVLNRLSTSEIKENFDHYGFFMGVVPIYVRFDDEDMPTIATRNWVPEWTLDMVEGICDLICMFDEDAEYSIKVTGNI